MSESSPAAAGTASRPRRIPLGGPATLIAAAAMALSAALLLHWLGRLTFWRDEWDFLLHRRSWTLDTFLHPFVEQLLAIPILIYRLLVGAFGMDSPLPFQIVSVALFIASAVMLFIYLRRRVGEWLALAGILPVLFLGPSWDDLLFPFQMALFACVACGIGALLALERHDRRWDVASMGLLLLALFSFALGIPFVAAATVEIAFGRDRWRRAFVVAVPTALWLIWYAGWGHEAHTFISLSNFANSPSYIVDGLAASLATWVGLGAGPYDASPLDWGRPLLVVALGLVAWRLYVLHRPSPRLAGTVVLLLGFWFLTALNTNPFAPATAGRYQYLGIVLMALVAAELANGLRVRRYATIAVVAAGVVAAGVNGDRLRQAANGLAGIAQQERGGLAALELTRGQVSPGFELTEQNSGVDYLGLLDAGSYFSAVDAYGSPAYTPAELASAPEAGRVAADEVSAAALGVRLQPGGQALAGTCAELQATTGAVVGVPSEGIILRASSGGTQARLRRYASDSFPVDLGRLPAGQMDLLRIPADRSPRTWSLQLRGGGRVTACRAQPA
ncbi:MAG TPA: hypothetical protein VHI77_08100 [Solirubrobacterales bacterium]|nr:hypothetical protein [Solirubrobacterales bacterium]